MWIDTRVGSEKVLRACGSLNHIYGAFLPCFPWPIILLCLALSPYLVYLRVLPCVRTSLFFFFNFIYLFIYLFLAVLGLRFCARAFSSCSEWGPLFITVRGPLTVAASPVAEHRLQMRRLSSCGSRA